MEGHLKHGTIITDSPKGADTPYFPLENDFPIMTGHGMIEKIRMFLSDTEITIESWSISFLAIVFARILFTDARAHLDISLPRLLRGCSRLLYAFDFWDIRFSPCSHHRTSTSGSNRFRRAKSLIRVQRAAEACPSLRLRTGYHPSKGTRA